jgi:N-acetyl-gamma-glutamyl-phosphate/LysW-gamma-L-alpha-aminoadipyl-6-phosphate reductase
MTHTASVVGGSGFTGGELLRLLSGHPEFEVTQATSRSYDGKTVGSVHPNLRGLDLRFSDPTDLDSVDVLFAATPHGVSMEQIDAFEDAADTVVDLSADFRLSAESQYDEWYDGHVCPEYLEKSEYALPELNRENLPGADLIAAGGCNATATILGLKPLFDVDILSGDEQVVVDVKVGSSEGGAGGGEASSHPERSGIVRPYAPTGHRHEAEIEEFLGLSVSFTVHAVDMTRGVYRYPEPKAVAGSNYGEVGFEVDPGNKRLVVFSAIDNMMKGSAGQAVHAANVALGFEETAGLDFAGLHPVGAP